MAGATRVVGIVGTYRKDGAIDQAVDVILGELESKGIETRKIRLVERDFGFCRNCRACTQTPGEQPGACVQHDDMTTILAEIEAADAFVLAAPVNFFNVTAIFRKFMERLVCFAYWPWDNMAPGFRRKKPTKRAVVVTSCAMPGVMARFLTGAVRALKATAKTIGAKTVGSQALGLVNAAEVTLSDGQRQRLRKLAARLSR